MKYISLLLMFTLSSHGAHKTVSLLRHARSFSCPAIMQSIHPLECIAFEYLSNPRLLRDNLLCSYPQLPRFPLFAQRACKALKIALTQGNDPNKRNDTQTFLRLMADMYGLRKKGEVLRFLQEHREIHHEGEWSQEEQCFFESLRQAVSHKVAVKHAAEMQQFLQQRGLAYACYNMDQNESWPIARRGVRTYFADALKKVCHDHYVYAPHVINDCQGPVVIIAEGEQQSFDEIIVIPNDLHLYDPLAIRFTLVQQLEHLLARSKGLTCPHEQVAHICGPDATRARIEMLEQVQRNLMERPEACGYTDELEVARAQKQFADERKILQSLVCQ